MLEKLLVVLNTRLMTETLPRQNQLMTLIRERLEHFPWVRLAIVFGSLGAGKGEPDSDLDIAVMADIPMDVEMKLNLIRDLAQVVNRPVDLIDLRNAGEPLLGEILTGGRRILGTDVEFANLLSRHLLDAADFLPYRERILRERRVAWTSKS